MKTSNSKAPPTDNPVARPFLPSIGREGERGGGEGGREGNILHRTNHSILTGD